MALNLSAELLAQFSKVIAEQLGLYFPPERSRELAQGLINMARELGFSETETGLQKLISTPLTNEQIKILANHLTVGETYFFREKQTFEALKEYVLPDLISSCQKEHKQLIVWSAGCCTGEEPYSLAILLKEVFLDINHWNVLILATDINPTFLKKAAEGVYSEWSFRNAPVWLKDKYFQKNSAGRFEILPEIKKMVQFSYLNLAENIYTPLLFNKAINLILCRNVLMYFTSEQSQQTIQKFFAILAERGWLIVSPSELSQTLFSQFASIHSCGAILYRKEFQNQPLQIGETDATKTESSSIILAQSPIDNEIPAIFRDNSQLNSFAMSGRDAEKKTISSTPEFPDVYKEAEILYQQGFYQETITKLLALVSSPQKSSKIFNLLAQAYANQGNLAEALAWCQKAITSNRLDAGCYYLQATILQESGQIEEALVALRRAIYIEPNFVLAHFTLGILTLEQQRRSEAAKHFENTLLLLGTYKLTEILPYSEGMMAGRLIETIKSINYHK